MSRRRLPTSAFPSASVVIVPTTLLVAFRTTSKTNASLKKLVFRCWEIEKDIKTGKIEMETGVEMLIMEICSLFRKK